MNRAIVLDANLLGLVTNPRSTPESLACAEWVTACLQSLDRILVSDITEYEVRRELIRAGKVRGIQSLDVFLATVRPLAVTREILLRAAQLWAQARKSGFAGAGDKELDADLILAAQILTLDAGSRAKILATTNVKHFNRFVDARLWRDIPV